MRCVFMCVCARMREKGRERGVIACVCVCETHLVLHNCMHDANILCFSIFFPHLCIFGSPFESNSPKETRWVRQYDFLKWCDLRYVHRVFQKNIIKNLFPFTNYVVIIIDIKPKKSYTDFMAEEFFVHIPWKLVHLYSFRRQLGK